MLKWVQSEINIDLWDFNFPQSLYTPKFVGFSSDENNQGLNQNVHFIIIIITIGCAMSDFLKLSNWPM
jgi:hypothetical protein